MNDQIPTSKTDGHYCYCRDAECGGCLPSDEALEEMHILPLWGEMLNRCIAQTPATKTREGALAAIRADAPSYRIRAEEYRAERFPNGLEAAE